MDRTRRNPAPHSPLVARIGRWSATNRWKAVGLWLAFVAICVVAGSATGLIKASEDAGPGESGRAERAISAGFPVTTASESVLIQARRGRITGPAGQSVISAVTAAVRAQPRVQRVVNPSAAAADPSADGRSALVTFELRGDAAQTEDASAATVNAVRTAARARPGFTIGEFGSASASAAVSKAFSDDFAKAERLSLPITLLILIFAFGSLIAAGVPLLLGLSAVMATLGLVNVVSHAIPVADAVSSVVLLVGLAVGVDYALFYLRRARDERDAGATPHEAVAIASATSGRAVIVSGLTVMVAMAGLFLAGDATFTALGIGAMLVVAVAMVGSVTVIPAVLSLLGTRVDRGRLPFAGRRRTSGSDHGAGVWARLVGASLRRPLLATVLSGGLLLALAVPALSMHTVVPGPNDLPRSLEVMRVYDRMQQAFPGGEIPAVVAVSATDVRRPEARAAIAAIERRAAASGHFFGRPSTRISADHHLAVLELPMRGDGTDVASTHALDALRGTIIPAALSGTSGVRADVTGMTAGTADFNALMASRAPLVVLFVLTLAFLLLLVTFRSIVVPVKAIVLNLLSVGAAYGVLVWIFQQGHLQGVLAYRSNGGVVSWLPIFLFVILFGLSMDYHVFILSRIREAVDRGRTNEEAVREGILATSGTVSSAALVMVAVFAIFATLSSIDMKQMGVGLAVAIAIDATIVRAALLPAVMQLLGERTWYLPRRLQWLPRISWEGPAAAGAAGAGATDSAPGRAARGRRRTPLRPRSASSPR